MYELILEDEMKHRLYFNKLGGAFTITEIQGLNPPSADISTNQVGLLDGQVYNSSKLQMRTVNIAFAIEYNAERSRQDIYDVIHSKKPIRIYYKSEYRNVYIDGFVQSVDFSYFSMKQICTVAILCPQPYLKAIEDISVDLFQAVPMFHFPFASTGDPGELVMSYIDYDSPLKVANDTGTYLGMTIEMYCTNWITNPKITNVITGEYIGAEITMQPGFMLEITTGAANKTASLIFDSGDGEMVKQNILRNILQGSTWLQLYPGENNFVVEVDSGDIEGLRVYIKYSPQFEGV